MSMDDNPYAPPRSGDLASGVKSGRLADLKTVAVAQKTIILCIALNFVAVAARMFATPEWLPFVMAALVTVTVVQTAAVMILAMKVYSTGTGIILGIGALLPCFGLIILLIVNSNANKILTQNGHHVGFFGTDLSGF
jgi:hypothetical protein